MREIWCMRVIGSTLPLLHALTCKWAMGDIGRERKEPMDGHGQTLMSVIFTRNSPVKPLRQQIYYWPYDLGKRSCKTKASHHYYH
jgi:hypothetical protein